MHEFDAFYRAGSLVFGGGHVVLPLLQAAVVPPGWVSNETFLAGYGAAQAVPGPLFTFAAYLGAVMGPAPERLARRRASAWSRSSCRRSFWSSAPCRSGMTCAAAPTAQAALAGVNAAVVGLLLAALYRPVWTTGITSAADFALACAAFLLLFMWQTPPWLVVILSAAAGALIANI